ncbi:hypothetical protein [Bergeyella zoohelcum]|uniref:RipA family octameric membrane protein n=1 Tax=Bergeyella zoohelcum TaxID=1015 RepID=UPI002A910512|nr:hypothetical protein [Bergeyella zoohelcum]MDY6026180.1 hypothetical protein [Bergeyella zoohelcum]
MEKKDTQEKEISLKEIRKDFYELRNFEISNLWQRSIFLSALLVLFFTGYGYLIIKLVENDIKKINYLLIHQICCVITLFAIIFSIIWIMMAKGSKAWFEVYERRILEIEKENELKIPQDYRMGSDCTPWDLDSNLLSNKAGAYSVSKINILIGQFLMIMWIILFLIHYIWSIVFSYKNSYCNVIDIIIFTLLPIFLLFILITAFCNIWAKSNSLTKPK